MTRRVPRMDDTESEAWLGMVTVMELLPAALDAQLRRDSGMTHFEFVVLSMLRLADAPHLRMTQVAEATDSTLPRLSHVVSRLEDRGLVERFPCEEDRRATNLRLTDAGRRAVVLATPGHVATARALVLDAIGPERMPVFAEAIGAVASRLDPSDRYASFD